FNAYENTNGQDKDRLFGNVQVSYKFTDNLTLMLRTGLDYYDELRERRRAFSTQRFPRGNYREDAIYFSEMNSDFLLTYSKTDNPTWSDTDYHGGNKNSQLNRFSQTLAPELLIPEIY